MSLARKGIEKRRTVDFSCPQLCAFNGFEFPFCTKTRSIDRRVTRVLALQQAFPSS